MGAVFISYRRGDSEGQARALSKELEEMIGKDQVFMDVDNIALGRDFRVILQERLESCDLMLALIGPDWTDVKDAAGNRRLESPSDFVRQEISAALKRNIPVTPVLVRGAQMPAQERLPDDLKDLSFRNGFELSHTRWESDVREMVKRLGLTKSSAATSSPAKAQSPVVGETMIRSIAEILQSPEYAASGTKTTAAKKSGTAVWATAVALVLVVAAGLAIWYYRGKAPAPDIASSAGAPSPASQTPVAAPGAPPSAPDVGGTADAPGAPAAAVEPVVVMAAIPDLAGLTPEEATRLLSAADFTLGKRQEVAKNDVSLGVIIAQDPGAAESRPKGSPVNITVAARRTAPDLAGMSLGQAQEALAKLGLKERHEVIKASTRKEDDHVMQQTPPSGTEIEGGGEAVLTVAITVPKRIKAEEKLYLSNGQLCKQICKDAGLTWKSGWSGSTNACTCDF